MENRVKIIELYVEGWDKEQLSEKFNLPPETISIIIENFEFMKEFLDKLDDNSTIEDWE